MVDYSRFDHIGSDSDSGDDGIATAVRSPSATSTALRPSATASAAATSAGSARGGSDSGGSGKGPVGAEGDSGASFTQPVMMTASKKGREGRIKFEHEGVSVDSLFSDRRCV